MVAHVDPHSVQTTPFCFTGGVGKLSLLKAGQSRVIIPQQVGAYSFYINQKISACAQANEILICNSKSCVYCTPVEE